LDSMRAVRRIIKNFKPDVVVGFGGFASGPTLRAAAQMNIPTVLQEQNSYAGVTNKLLSKSARAICVAYEGLEKYFPINKIVLTGNPVRADIVNVKAKRKEGLNFFGLDGSKKTVFVSGGSLGARTLNNCIEYNTDFFKQHADIQVVWQCGKIYFDTLKTCETAQLPNVHLLPFVQRMDLAYAVADIVIARAGALTISELCLVGVPVILVPSPNVAEDHQTKNAATLLKKNAAVLMPDSEAAGKTLPMVLDILNDTQIAQSLVENILKFGKPDAAKDIVKVIISQTS
jgi:UDP-N-acetylglucosamine--N-acetylmuramyl-(pentapeptide) pyrophosphoryl-undecaprenol N-acetylglucosamine transferase